MRSGRSSRPLLAPGAGLLLGRQEAVLDATIAVPAVAQDLFGRRIVGWGMDRDMRSELVVAALQLSVAARRPPKGTIHHSDHGTATTTTST